MELDGSRAYLLAEIKNRLHENPVIDTIFKLEPDILEVMEAERMMLYGCDPVSLELVSKCKLEGEIKEIRIKPDFSSIAGYAVSSKNIVIINDAYDRSELNAIDERLKFDSSWDEKSGFRTKEVMAGPILYSDLYILGALQFINNPTKFDETDELVFEQLTSSLALLIHRHAVDIEKDTQGRSADKEIIELLEEYGYWDSASPHRQDVVSAIQKIILDKQKAEDRLKQIQSALNIV